MQVSPYSPDSQTPQHRVLASQSWPQTSAERPPWYEITQTTRTFRGPFFDESPAFEPNTPQQQAHKLQQAWPYTLDHSQGSAAPHQGHRVSLDSAQSLPAAHFQAKRLEASSPRHITGFFVGDAEKHRQLDDPMALFGPDFVTNVMEYFYIREKPVSPQPEDGVIKTPTAVHLQFRDGFKVDITGHGISEQRMLRDLPGREIISCQRRRKSAFNTIMICAGPVADDRNLIASVVKHGEKKAIIEVKGATHYFAEGDLFDRNFKITKGGMQVAQVCRDDNARAAVTSKHSYCVQVAAGTDCVLIIAVAMAVEDMYHK